MTSSSSLQPVPRQNHIALPLPAPDSTQMLMLGGLTNGVFLSDLWLYEPLTNAWTRLSPSGPIPGQRGGAMMASLRNT